MSMLDRIGQKLLFSFDPETAHGLSIAALRCGLPVASRAPHDARLEVRLCGLDFPNPLGMAAGYDKNAEVPDALLGLGFGFAEVGTITPLPQPGNPKPRIFRLTADEAVINRLGFNNEGHEAAERRLAARKRRGGIVGVNIGANKDSADRIGDYERGVTRFARYASYLTVNISSPNTPGLRNMQAREQLGELLSRVTAARAASSVQPPVFLKIAPDLVDAELEDVAAEVIEKKIEGVIVSNTTLARTGLRRTTAASETGGLSGRPLFERSTAVLARMRKLLGPEIAIIGVGGVDSAETALEKIRAGADLVQLYTGMIYAGPALPGRIVAGMVRLVEKERLKSIAALRDTRCQHWAAKSLS
ncbi:MULTISPECIES: quinone-dependent dihydroorotate dehydrogenase [unclassified Mesorhizobium]|uniref:quinone-dependent dihydroorotate dehydrogenase n=2 Tax=Mesorhizobium TaxID=68287 RepID=UPI000BB0799D|nr:MULTISPECIES: quinone-dependent dihydroorotate dehydrogenase [unclassified Mesorhizobium]TGT53821.1 quinone-dependent dihydroorotate dehydrogenase [Mesorhizobium sp. M00.F.Ca.ET.170.01.1.1]AZO09819.1 quinone-dependent dihydroorotate dehydrogenase [Mesorhizobium sp. M3A.F.Ca.ET.080.04.2.1]PBB85242.1 dihydroorotate dehydrogenase (quinone) [Mesorhizobium sp. WSM3876]RWE27509.1 MAG: quinone-dependent dihydroorotate dehydrogenase [Mesorhizobium sp.]RWF26837.1 MAG: quinone-dependent dihydroorotat